MASLPQYKVLTYNPPRRLPRDMTMAEHAERFLNENIEPAYRIAETVVLGNLWRIILELRD